ncbi:hypothetical protein BN7874_109 [Phage NCTB]|nr:hypothetical protein BN7874_109 [Phage NCTB]
MKSVKFIRYFLPLGEFLESWKSYSGIEEFKRVMTGIQDRLSCYTLHIDDSISGLFLHDLDTYDSLDTDVFSKRFSVVNYLGTSFRKHPFKNNSNVKQRVMDIVSELKPHLPHYLEHSRNIQMMDSSFYQCSLQLLFNKADVIPIVSVLDQLDADGTPVFEPPAGDSWLEIPSGLLHQIIYRGDTKPLIDSIYKGLESNEFSTDVILIETLTKLMNELKANRSKWSAYDIQEQENKIHTILQLVKRSGLNVDALMQRLG